MEIWKPIKGFESSYEISNLGRVKSLARKVGTCYRRDRILSPRITKDGYLQVTLKSDGKQKYHAIARLVGMHFIPNPNNLETVNHKDGNKQNNNVNNLEWMSQSDQMYHAYALGLKKPKRGSDNIHSKLTNQDVKDIRQTYKRYCPNGGSSVALSKKYNVSHRVILLIVKNESYKNVK